MYSLRILRLALVLASMNACLAFAPVSATATSSRADTALWYKALPHDDDVQPVRVEGITTCTAKQATEPMASVQVVAPNKKKATIPNLGTLNQLVDFIEEDDRISIVKFYAPWCKTCQRLGMHYDRLATALGDHIVDRRKVKGAVRFAQIEYGPRTKELIEEIQVDSIPTLQVYLGQNKLFDLSGMKSTKEVERLLQELLSLDDQELAARAEKVDDGVLKNAVEDAFYAPPDFLNEEW